MPAKIKLPAGTGLAHLLADRDGHADDASWRKLPAVSECKCLLLGRHRPILVASEGGDRSTDQESASVR
jgi:hypothetical protein